MVVGIVSIGDELLIGRTLNTNMNYVAKQLTMDGIKVVKELTVRDEKDEIVSAINFLRSEVDVIITIGGLGVTSDDITKKVIADYLRLKLVFDPDALTKVQQFCKDNERPFTDIMRLFALIPQGSVAIPNKTGIAAGCMLNLSALDIIMLPGPPDELIPMFCDYVMPYLKGKLDVKYEVVVIKIFGIREVDVFLALKEYIEKYKDKVVITTYASLLEVAIIIRFPSGTSGNVAESVLYDIYSKFKNNIYADNDITLQEQLVRKLSVFSKTVAVAESVSGGNISEAIVSIDGASKVLLEGIVSYSNESKMQRLGVNAQTLNTYGAVSEQVAFEMAQGLLDTTKADMVIATTGIAGPTGGSAEKPVGLCYIAIGDREKIKVYKHIFVCNNRDEVRELVKKTALFYCIKKIK